MRASIQAITGIRRATPYITEEGVGQAITIRFGVTIVHQEPGEITQQVYAMPAELALTDQQVRHLIRQLADQLPEIEKPPKRRWWRKC